MAEPLGQVVLTLRLASGRRSLTPSQSQHVRGRASRIWHRMCQLPRSEDGLARASVFSCWTVPHADASLRKSQIRAEPVKPRSIISILPLCVSLLSNSISAWFIADMPDKRGRQPE